MSILNRLSRVAKAALNEGIKPESFAKGEEFEDYVRQYVFPSERYELIHRTNSYQANKNDYIESTLLPDFRFRCKETGREFFVEAKFRGNAYNDKVEWTYYNQLQRYHQINNQLPVFLCLGLYGKPKDPEFLFIIPISKIRYTGLFFSFLERYEFYKKKPVFPQYLWNLYLR